MCDVNVRSILRLADEYADVDALDLSERIVRVYDSKSRSFNTHPIDEPGKPIALARLSSASPVPEIEVETRTKGSSTLFWKAPGGSRREVVDRVLQERFTLSGDHKFVFCVRDTGRLGVWYVATGQQVFDEESPQLPEVAYDSLRHRFLYTRKAERQSDLVEIVLPVPKAGEICRGRKIPD